MDDTKIISQPSNEQHLSVIMHFLKMTREGVYAHIDEEFITDERKDYFVNDCQDEYYYSLS